MIGSSASMRRLLSLPRLVLSSVQHTTTTATVLPSLSLCSLSTSSPPTPPDSASPSSVDPAASSPSSTSSVDPAEIAKFSALASEWWDARGGPFAGLHSYNMVRVPLIANAARRRPGRAPEMGEPSPSPLPLNGISVLDIGCGGGILSEALGTLGATVLGVDAAERNVKVASAHLSRSKTLTDRVSYRHVTAEQLFAEQRTFDVVVASEVIEHVTDAAAFATTCVELTKPGGAMVFTTINKTALSALTAIGAAEYLLGLLPVGTHEWNKFVRPEDLKASLLAAHPSVVIDSTFGTTYNPLLGSWSVVPFTSVNYGVIAFRE